MLSEQNAWLVVDVAGALALLIAAASAWLVGRNRPGRARIFWFGAGVGLAFLAADERFSLHERLGRWLHERGAKTPAGINHLDDLVLIAIAAAALGFALLFLREVVADRRFAATLAAAALVTAAALAVDATAPVEGWAPRIEEILELTGQCALLVAFVGRARKLEATLPRRWPWKARGAPALAQPASES